MFFASPLMTPFSTSGSTPSANISVWIPRFLWFPSCASTALGMAPIPICSVAPSSISAAQCLPMAVSISLGSVKWASMSGVSSSTKRSIFDIGIMAWPNERGTCLFTTAITWSAHSTAASVASTDVPSDTKPCLSGVETWIMATLHGTAPQR